MVDTRIDELIKLSREIIGPRLKDRKCVYCGEYIPPGEYCHCHQAEKINPQYVKLKELIDKNSSVLDIKELTSLKIKEAQFPTKFAGMDFTDYITETAEQKNNLQLTISYAKNALKHYFNGTNLIFVGNFGNGKSMLMSIAGEDIIRNFGIQIKYVNVYDLSEKIKKTFSEKNESSAKITDEYKKAQILILDDVDKVQPTPWICDLMYGIANYRADNKLPTWINANHSLEDLSNKFFGEATISRFYDNSIKAKFTGVNWRLK